MGMLFPCKFTLCYYDTLFFFQSPGCCIYLPLYLLAFWVLRLPLKLSSMFLFLYVVLGCRFVSFPCVPPSCQDRVYFQVSGGPSWPRIHPWTLYYRTNYMEVLEMDLDGVVAFEKRAHKNWLLWVKHKWNFVSQEMRNPTWPHQLSVCLSHVCLVFPSWNNQKRGFATDPSFMTHSPKFSLWLHQEVSPSHQYHLRSLGQRRTKCSSSHGWSKWWSIPQLVGSLISLTERRSIFQSTGGIFFPKSSRGLE